MTDRTTRLADGEDDDLEIASPEDYEVQRNDEGDILPVKQRIPGTDDALLVKPMPPGAFNEWKSVLEGQDEDTEKQAEVMREWIVEGPGADATAEYVEDQLRGGVVAGLLKAIRNAAGYEVLKGNREEEMEEGLKVLDQVEGDRLKDLVDLGEELNGR